MAISRYYGAKPQEYVSQFVPENLALMQNALNQRQQSADKTADEMSLYKDSLLNEKALKGFDTEQLEGVRSELDEFTSSISKKDLSLPQNAREVSSYIKNLKNDPRLQNIRQGVASKAKYDKIIEEYRKDGKGLKYAYENDDFIRSFTDYMNQKGDDRKFAIDFIGGKEVIQAGVDMYADKEKHFKNISASGRESIRKISDGDITRYFKEGATGKSYDKILGVAKTEFDDYRRSAGGQQMSKWIDTYRPDLKTDQEKAEYMFKDFLETGKKQVGVNYTTNKDVALNQLAKEQAEKAYALIQDGKTAGYFAQYNNMDDFNNEIKSLNASINPEDHRKAAQMEEQRERLNDKFFETLTKKEETLMKIGLDQIKGKDALVKKVLRNLFVTRTQEVTGKYPRFETTSVPDFDAFDSEQLNAYLEQYIEAIGIEDVTEAARYAVGKGVGLDYGDISNRRDDYISKGDIFEAKDIILSSSKGSTQARNDFGDQAKTAINGINWDVIGSTTEKNIPLNQAIQTLDKQTIKGIDGINGPEIYFKYKDADGKFQDMTIQSKDVGGRMQETTINAYSTLAGGDQSIFNALVESHVYSNIKPIGSTSSYNQKEDIKVALGNILNSTINNYSQEDQVEYYNGTIGAIKELDNYKDVKIVRVGNKVTLKADGNTLVEPQENVADLMDEFRDTSK